MTPPRLALLGLITATAAALSAHAQSFCDLVPAAVVQSTLGLTVPLTATPNTDGGNGCDYKGTSTGPITLDGDSISDTGIYKTLFDHSLHDLGSTQQLVPGIGEGAYYDLRQHQQKVTSPGLTFTQQSIVFRAKGKIVNLILAMPGTGVPKAAMLALATYAISKPLNTLKDPK